MSLSFMICIVLLAAYLMDVVVGLFTVLCVVCSQNIGSADCYLASEVSKSVSPSTLHQKKALYPRFC